VSPSRDLGPCGEASQSGGLPETAHPDDALMLRLSAQKLWSEGRANPVWYRCSTWIGSWATEDRITWHTTDGKWVAQLERSANGRHTSLAPYNQAGYVGRQDANGFHVPSRPRHAKRPRPAMRSLPLPLAG
jgi:hypothetical protein